MHNVQVNKPDGKADPQLGKTVLDEPKTKQSDPTVLDLQLRAIAKQPNVKPVVSIIVYVPYHNVIRYRVLLCCCEHYVHT